MKLIINADDFGMSKAINYGIIEAFLSGSITSTTMMVNMNATIHATTLLNQYPTLPVGLHFNMTFGKPITNVKTLTNKSGYFMKPQDNPDISLFSSEEIYQEIKGQYELFIKLTKKKPTHFDSHLYAHQIWPNVKEQMNKFAKEVNLPVRDLKINDFQFVNFLRNNSLLSKDQNTADHIKALFFTFKQYDICELMVHPGYVDQFIYENSSYNIQRVFELEILNSQLFKQQLRDNKITLVSYKDV